MSSTTSSATTPSTPAVTKTYDHNGTDFKSVLLNISSIVFFIFPFVAFFVSQYNGFSINDKNNIYGATIAATLAFYVLAYIAPPIGWRRPHPYSDDPTNVPFTFDKNK